MGDTTARVSRLPAREGERYDWGGEFIITIGERAIMIGADESSEQFAREIADAWNARQQEQPR